MATKKCILPIGAVAMTSLSSQFMGRRATSGTTAKATNAITKDFFHQATLYYRRNYFTTNNNNKNLILLQQRNFASSSTTARKAPSLSSSNKKNLSFLEWYEGHLESNPIRTKMVTGSILWGIGDVVAQLVPALVFNDNNSNNVEDAKIDASKKKENFNYDYSRTARAVIFGFGIHAPLSHLHFNLLESMTIMGGFTGIRIPIFKAFMEQIVYWSWFSNSLYHGCMGAMQGFTLQEIKQRIQDVLWETQKAQWIFWIPIQLLNFRFVPVRHQLNVVLCTSVVWTALLSAWYPPEEEETEVAAKKEEEENPKS